MFTFHVSLNSLLCTLSLVIGDRACLQIVYAVYVFTKLCGEPEVKPSVSVPPEGASVSDFEFIKPISRGAFGYVSVPAFRKGLL